MLLVSALAYSQDKWSATEKESYCSVSFSVDGRNAVMGSEPTNNKPSLDGVLGVHMVGNNFEIGVSDELFNKLGFNRFSLNFGYHSQRYIPLGDKELDFCIVPFVGASTITRWGLGDREVKLPSGETEFRYGKSSHIAVQGGLSFLTKITDRLLLDVTMELSTRPDLLYHYPTDNPKSFVESNYVGIHYIIN